MSVSKREFEDFKIRILQFIDTEIKNKTNPSLSIYDVQSLIGSKVVELIGTYNQFFSDAIVALASENQTLISTIDLMSPGFSDLHALYSYGSELEISQFDILDALNTSLTGLASNLISTGSFSDLVKSSWQIVDLKLNFPNFQGYSSSAGYSWGLATNPRTNKDLYEIDFDVKNLFYSKSIPVNKANLEVNKYKISYSFPILKNGVGSLVQDKTGVYVNGTLDPNCKQVFDIPQSGSPSITVNDVVYYANISGVVFTRYLGKDVISSSTNAVTYDITIEFSFGVYFPFLSTISSNDNIPVYNIGVIWKLFTVTAPGGKLIYNYGQTSTPITFFENSGISKKTTGFRLSFTATGTNLDNSSDSKLRDFSFDISMDNTTDFNLSNYGTNLYNIAYAFPIYRSDLPINDVNFRAGDMTSLNLGVSFFPSLGIPRDLSLLDTISYLDSISVINTTTLLPKTYGDLSVIRLQTLLPPGNISIVDNLSIAASVSQFLVALNVSDLNNQVITLNQQMNLMINNISVLSDTIDQIVTQVNNLAKSISSIATELQEFEKQTSDNFTKLQDVINKMSGASGESPWSKVGTAANILGQVGMALSFAGPLAPLGIALSSVSAVLSLTLTVNSEIQNKTDDIVGIIGATLSATAQLLALRSTIKNKFAQLRLDQVTTSTLKLDADILNGKVSNIKTTQLSTPTVEIMGRPLSVTDSSIPIDVNSISNGWISRYKSSSNYKNVTNYLVDIGAAPIHTNYRYTSSETPTSLVDAPTKTIVSRDLLARDKIYDGDTYTSSKVTGVVLSTRQVSVVDFKPGLSLAEQRLAVNKGITNADHSLVAKTYIEQKIQTSDGVIHYGIEDTQSGNVSSYFNDVASGNYTSLKTSTSLLSTDQHNLLINSLTSWPSYKLGTDLTQYNNCQTVSGILFNFNAKLGKPTRFPDSVWSDYSTGLLVNSKMYSSIAPYIPTFNMTDVQAAQYMVSNGLV